LPQELTGRAQPARERAAREQPAPWHSGKRDTQDEPVRPNGAVGHPAGSYQAEADRYPADFPTQVFMSSAQAAWQQPAQAAPAGNWPRIDAPPAPPARPSQPEPAGWDQSADPAAARRARGPARAAGPRHATAGAPPEGGHPSWGQDPAGPEQYPAAAARQAAAGYPAAPFPPAPDPAELYPAPPGPARAAGHHPARSRPSAQRRGARAGLLVGMACLAVLIAVALVLFVALSH